MRTIIVRLFEPAADTGDVHLHGFVEDIGRGTRQRFTRAAQLLAAIEAIAADPAAQNDVLAGDHSGPGDIRSEG
ncbi:MAG: hypothetical protein ACRDT6_27575 [Micromonosporaceae bacterium]